MCVDMCLTDTLDSTIAKTIIILNHFDIWQYNFVCLICCYYLMLIKIISFYLHIWMDIDEVYMDWHIQNMQWNCQASNYMKKVCFSMAILFCHKSHITCPSEKMKIGKDEDGNFKEDSLTLQWIIHALVFLNIFFIFNLWFNWWRKITIKKMNISINFLNSIM